MVEPEPGIGFFRAPVSLKRLQLLHWDGNRSAIKKGQIFALQDASEWKGYYNPELQRIILNHSQAN